jgi:hypothetical protein
MVRPAQCNLWLQGMAFAGLFQLLKQSKTAFKLESSPVQKKIFAWLSYQILEHIIHVIN